MAPFRQKTKFEEIRDIHNHDKIVAKRRKITLWTLLVIAVVVAVYLIGAYFFSNFFFPRTVINGINCSWRSASMSNDLFQKSADDYTLTLYEMDDETEEIVGSDIQMEIQLGEDLQNLIDEQNGFTWVSHLFHPTEITIDSTVLYNEQELASVMDALDCFDEENVTPSEAPQLIGYTDGVGYEVSEPVYGNDVSRATLLLNLHQAVQDISPSIDLVETDCYNQANFASEYERLSKLKDLLNEHVNRTITYEFGSEQEVLNGTQLSEWLVIREEPEEGSDEEARVVTLEELLGDSKGDIDLDRLTFSFDQDRLAEFVYGLAYDHNTKYLYHDLVTHTGETVTVDGGNYGWYLDQAATLEALNGYLDAEEDYTGEAIFEQRAAQFDFPDYGNTYLEVSLSEQHFWYYRDGVLTLDSDFVSGNPSTGHATPTGTYEIAYKARDQVLEGQGYSSPVSYWMPFYAGVGFHDASWRSSFGDSIYLTNGSHGCLNLPPSVAETLYGYIEGGECVLIY